MNGAPKVLFLIGAEHFGGAERQLAALAAGLHRKGRPVAVALCHAGEPLRTELRPAGVRVVPLERNGRGGAIGFLWRTIRTLRTERPAVVHGYLNGPNLLAVLLKPFAPRTRIVWGIRDSNMDRTRYTRLHRVKFGVTRWVARFADLIIVNSAAGAEHHRREGYPARSMVVVPNGIDTDRFRPDPAARRAVRAEWGIGDDEILVGLVARLDPMKDHRTFLRAAARLTAEHPHMRFVCVGSGPEDYRAELEVLSHELGLGDRVLWVGARDDVEAVQNAFDIGCSASAFGEGFSNAIGEAMASGVPCVVTRVGDSGQVVGNTGIAVPPRDPEALAAGLRELAASLTPERRDACRRRMVEEFSVPRLIDRTEGLLWSRLSGRD